MKWVFLMVSVLFISVQVDSAKAPKTPGPNLQKLPLSVLNGNVGMQFDPSLWALARTTLFSGIPIPVLESKKIKNLRAIITVEPIPFEGKFRPVKLLKKHCEKYHLTYKKLKRQNLRVKRKKTGKVSLCVLEFSDKGIQSHQILFIATNKYEKAQKFYQLSSMSFSWPAKEKAKKLVQDQINLIVRRGKY